MGQTTEELNSDIAARRRALADDLDALQDKVSPSAIAQRKKQAAYSRVRGVGSKIMGTAQSVTDTGSQAMDDTANAVSGTASAVTGTASDLADTAQEQFAGSPLAAGLVAFGTGLVIAGLMPSSQAEARVASKVVDTAKEQTGPLQDAVKSGGQQIAEQLRDEATSAAQQVKETAQESVAHVKDEAADSAQHVSSEVSS